MFLEVHCSENIDLNHLEMPQTCLRLATKMENKQNNPQQLNKAPAFLMKPEVKGRAQPLRSTHSTVTTTLTSSVWGFQCRTETFSVVPEVNLVQQKLQETKKT